MSIRIDQRTTKWTIMTKFDEIKHSLLSRKVKDLYPTANAKWLELALYEVIYLAEVTLRSGEVKQYIIATNTFTSNATFFNPENGGKELPLWTAVNPVELF